MDHKERNTAEQLTLSLFTLNLLLAVLAFKGLPRWVRCKEPVCQCRRHRRPGFDPWVRKIPWRRKWQSIPVFLPGESHGQRSLAGYSPWGHKRVRHDLVTKQHISLTTEDHLARKNKSSNYKRYSHEFWHELELGKDGLLLSCFNVLSHPIISFHKSM